MVKPACTTKAYARLAKRWRKSADNYEKKAAKVIGNIFYGKMLGVAQGLREAAAELEKKLEDT